MNLECHWGGGVGCIFGLINKVIVELRPERGQEFVK